MTWQLNKNNNNKFWILEDSEQQCYFLFVCLFVFPQRLLMKVEVGQERDFILQGKKKMEAPTTFSSMDLDMATLTLRNSNVQRNHARKYILRTHMGIYDTN